MALLLLAIVVCVDDVARPKQLLVGAHFGGVRCLYGGIGVDGGAPIG